MRVLAIGDIHGCSTALVTVLKAAGVTREDTLIFLGDYIDRGPDSKGVISTILDYQRLQRVVALRGNHECMLLDAGEDPRQCGLWCSNGGDATLASYGAGGRKDWQPFVPPEHWTFFHMTRPWFETQTHIFLHATLDPDLDMPDQPDFLLYWERHNNHSRHKSGKTVVCGHTPQRSGRPCSEDRSVCIDTGACLGNWLTCLDVESGSYWQANEEGKSRAGTLELD